jgi:hypothetical protein
LNLMSNQSIRNSCLRLRLLRKLLLLLLNLDDHYLFITTIIIIINKPLHKSYKKLQDALFNELVFIRRKELRQAAEYLRKGKF